MADDDPSERSSLRIGELSRRSGVSRDTLRFYEAKGLLGETLRVRITSPDPEARAAIHAFLQAQIEDHRTGDSVDPAPGR